MLSKNTVLDLWHEFENVPFVERSDCEQFLDAPEGFLGFPYGTTKATIWDWFDKAFQPWGGLPELLENDPQPERKFQVQTPAGIIECYAKYDTDTPGDYPGVYIDVRSSRKQLSNEQVGDLAAAVEYDSTTGNLQTVVYELGGREEPSHIEVYSCKKKTFTTEEKLLRDYELFKLRWMLGQDLTWNDIFNLLNHYIEDANIQADAEGVTLGKYILDQSRSAHQGFQEYLEERGFGGMLWPCYDEWLETEAGYSNLTFGKFAKMAKSKGGYMDVYAFGDNKRCLTPDDVPESAIVLCYNRCGGNYDVAVRFPLHSSSDANKASEEQMS